MAKKKVNPKSFSKEDIQAGLEILHKEYFMNVIALTSYDPDATTLNYIKVPIVTPDGGTYLVSILHVDGPKINLKSLDDSENKNPEE